MIHKVQDTIDEQGLGALDYVDVDEWVDEVDQFEESGIIDATKQFSYLNEGVFVAKTK